MSVARFDKRALIVELRAQLAREIELLTQVAHLAREAATHEEAKPENDKDTRAIEAAYLAGAQADRVRDLQQVDNGLAFLGLRDFREGDEVGLGALVDLELDGAILRYFLAPHGGGMKAAVGGVDVQVITPQSALGQAMLGKQRGDAVEVRGPRGLREYEIVGIA